MGKAYSEDLRLKALAALDGGMKKMAVHRAFGVSRSTFLARRWMIGWLCAPDKALSPAPPGGTHGQRLLRCGQVRGVREAPSRSYPGPDARVLGARRGATAEREDLLDLAWSPWLDAQKKSWLYAERDEAERADFLKQLVPVALEDRVYVDEAGVEDTLGFAWGWSLRGVRCLAQKLGHRTSRVSLAAAWCHGEVLAPLTFEGYCH